MLKRYIIEDYKNLVDDKITEHLRSREVFHPSHEMDWYTIRKFLLHRTPTSRDKSSLLQYLSGNNITPAWLHSHGWVIDHKCSCGEIDNIGHWLAGCPARTMRQEAHSLGNAKLLETISRQPPPDPSRPFAQPKCFVDGVSTSPELFRWHPGQPIYTDGSCLFANIRILAVASCAAVHLQPVLRTLQYSLPECFPQSAVASEHVAAVVAVDKLCTGDKAHIVSDCQAVVGGVHHPDHVRMGHRNPMGGFWADIGNKVASITKVKAHLSKASADLAGEGQHHQCNLIVDLLAKAALPQFNHVEIDCYLKTLEPKLKAPMWAEQEDLRAVRQDKLQGLTQAKRCPPCW